MTYFVIFCIVFTAYRFIRRAVIVTHWLWKTRNDKRTPFLMRPWGGMHNVH